MNPKLFQLREKIRFNPLVAHALYLGQSLKHANSGDFRAKVLAARKGAPKGKGVALCCRIRDEARYIREWVEYYLAAGVDHIFYYEKLSTDNFREVLQPYIDRGVVTLSEDWPHYPVSPAAEQDCILRTIGRYEWVGFIDADEFVVVRDGSSIPEFLAGYKDAVAVGLCNYVYGSSGHKMRPTGPVIVEYQHRGANVNPHVKCFVRPETVANYRNSHSWYYQGMRHAITEKGRAISGTLVFPPTAEKAWLNHYHHKSDQDYFEKAARKSVLDTAGIKFITRSPEKHAGSETKDNAVIDDCAVQYYLTRCKAANIEPILFKQQVQTV